MAINNVLYLHDVKERSYFPERDHDKNYFLKEISRLGLKKFYHSCCICDWDRSSIDLAHLVPHNQDGYYTFDNILPLCPNHHRQLDYDDMNDIETEAVQAFFWNVMNVISPWK